MTDIIVLIVIVLIVGFAIRKVVLDRKHGVTCGSCPTTGSKDCHCEE